jgi:hypothetical protein
MAQFRTILGHLFLEESRMIRKAPSQESDQRPDDEPKKLEALTHKPKAAFQWPPDCLWPFMDDAPGTDTEQDVLGDKAWVPFLRAAKAIQKGYVVWTK